MDIPVFFFENIPSADIIALNEDISRHAVQVLRMKKSEILQLTDGAGSLLTTQITDDHKKNCTVTVIKKETFPKKKREICIAISLLKNTGRFEWFLEKATEIGVTEIIPLLGDRTEKQHVRHDRMKQILISAMIQSKQVWLPVLHQPTAFSAIVSENSFNKKLIAYCDEGEKRLLKDFTKDNSIQILIGPEGDFSSAEIAAALQNNYIPVTLGGTRLRTETAGVVAATLLCV